MSFYHALLGRALAGGGGSEPVLISKTITSNGMYNASDDNADGYKDVSVSVPNTYTASDEDKVVHNGALVAQTSDTVTVNGTVDTTLISSLIVNVSGGSGGLLQIAKLETNDTSLSIFDMYICESSLYFFVFGVLGKLGTEQITMTIPDSFDISNIATYRNGAVLRVDVNSSTPMNAIMTRNSRNLTVNKPYDWRNAYIGVFLKST